MYRTLAVVVALLACGLAVSTGATVFTEVPGEVGDSPPQAEEFDSLDGESDLIAYPHPGPNGVYASLDEDGEIAIEISEHTLENASGVSAGSTTSVDDIFVLENEGDTDIDVWIKSNVSEIEYRSDAEPLDEEERPEGDGVTFTVGPDDPVAVGLTVDATEVDAGSEIEGDFSIKERHVTGSGDTAEDGEGAMTTETTDGEWYAASTDVSVTGDGDARSVEVDSERRDADAEADLDLEIGPGVTLEAVELELSNFADVAFEVEAVSGTAELDAMPGEVDAEPVGAYVVRDTQVDDVDGIEYRFTVEREVLEDRRAEGVSLYRHGDDGWEDVGAAVVERTDEEVTYVATLDRFSTYAVGLDAPDLSVTGLETVSEDPVADEPLRTAVTVENDGAAPGELSEPVTVNGERVEVVETTVEPGDTETVAVEWTPEAPGSYEIDAGEASATVVVDEADTPPGDAADDTEEPGDGSSGDDGSTDESPSDGDGSVDDDTTLAAETEGDSTPTVVEPIEEQAGITPVGGLGLLLGLTAALGTLWIARRRGESGS